MSRTDGRPRRPPGGAVVWRWPDAWRGLCYALPAVALVAAVDVGAGLAWAVGTMMAALLPLPPERRRRVLVVAVGLLAAGSVLVGSVLTRVPVLAVAGMLLIPVGAARLATRSGLGALVLQLCVPLIGMGLSYRDPGEGAAVAALIAGGSVTTWLLSLAWPARSPARPPGPARAPLDAAVARSWGLRLGGATATAAAVGYLADLDHVGWATAAAAFVMRPDPGLQHLRGYGRFLSVVAGGAAALLLVRLLDHPAVIAVAAALVLAAATATRGSRWYITAGYSTFFVVLLLAFTGPGPAVAHFNERLAETALGMGLAFLFSLRPARR